MPRLLIQVKARNSEELKLKSVKFERLLSVFMKRKIGGDRMWNRLHTGEFQIDDIKTTEIHRYIDDLGSIASREGISVDFKQVKYKTESKQMNIEQRVSIIEKRLRLKESEFNDDFEEITLDVSLRNAQLAGDIIRDNSNFRNIRGLKVKQVSSATWLLSFDPDIIEKDEVIDIVNNALEAGGCDCDEHEFID